MDWAEEWKTRLSRDKLSHAYLIFGENRKELASLLAKAYVCTGTESKPCGICAGCRKASSGIHPDIVRLGEDGAALKVEEIRALRADAYIRPNEASRKVYILENAETMNASGQNVLLKLLEEGPAYAAFLFLAPNPEELLPTVRSRCESIRAEDPSPAPPEEHPDASRLEELILKEDTLALAELAVELEKQDREGFALLLDSVRRRLRYRLPQESARLLPLMENLDQLRASCQFNVGTGHLAGALLTMVTSSGK